MSERRLVVWAYGAAFSGAKLRRLLSERGRLDVAEAGVTGLTNDGGTVYVHLLPRPRWPHRARGRAYVLAWEDYAPPGSDSMYSYRWLMGEERTSLRENIGGVIRWLEGK